MNDQVERVAAIVRSSAGYFGADGVLYPQGALVPEYPGVPADEVSDEEYRTREVEYEAKNGDLRMRTIKVASLFRPANDSASSPERVDKNNAGAFKVNAFLSKNAADIVSDIKAGSVEAFLDVIESAEVAGANRKTITDAIAAARDSE